MSIRICVVGNNYNSNSFIRGLKGAVGLRFLGIYPTGEEALCKQPDVVLVDIHLLHMDAFECAAKLKARVPQLSVLMMAEDDNEKKSDMVDWTFISSHAGANGCLLESLPSSELVEIIKQVHKKAMQGRRMVVMTPQTDRLLGKATRHFSKIVDIINAPSVVVRYGQDWRTVTMIGSIAKVP